MKKILTFALIIIGFTAFAQNKNQQNAKSKLEAARIALITERLDLTPDQAQQFWPMYNEYAEQRRSIQQDFRQLRQGMDIENLTEEQGKKLVAARMDGKQKQLDLETSYSERLMNVINTRQFMSLKKAEDDFRSMIIRRLEQRQRQQSQQQQMMLQRERKKQQGNN